MNGINMDRRYITCKEQNITKKSQNSSENGCDRKTEKSVREMKNF